MSDDGRYVTYTSSVDLANTKGTLEPIDAITGFNLFLFDRVLGLTWKITKEGPIGDAFDAEIERFCCPTASSSKQRGTCSLKDQYRGFCCWQRPCSFPALHPDISGDGSSIVFYTDFAHADVVENNREFEIYHYHTPTDTFTAITDSPEPDDFPAINYKGDVMGWTSDFDYDDNASIRSTNQIFAANVDMGCSAYESASNYMAAPDLEVCCEWNDGFIGPSPQPVIVTTLQLVGDLDAMMNNVPFRSSETDEMLCEQYAMDVKKDVACALHIPEQIVSVLSDDSPSCSHITGHEDGTISVTLGLHSVAYTSGVVDDFPSPHSLAKALGDEYDSMSGPLWKGYLTKTLDDTVPPVSKKAPKAKKGKKGSSTSEKIPKSSKSKSSKSPKSPESPKSPKKAKEGKRSKKKM